MFSEMVALSLAILLNMSIVQVPYPSVPIIAPHVVAVYYPPSPTPTPLATETPAPSPTPLPTETPSPTPTPIKSEPTDTPTPTPTDTPTPLPTDTPIPTPTPIQSGPTAVPTVAAPVDITGLFSKYSGQYSVDENLLKRIASCESSFNPNAVNGDYLGMFQFAARTWSSVRTTMGADPNPDLRTNAEEAIKTAAFYISTGHQSAWGCK